MEINYLFLSKPQQVVTPKVSKMAFFSSPKGLNSLEKDTFCPSFKGGQSDVENFSKLFSEILANPLKNSQGVKNELTQLFSKAFKYVTSNSENFINNGNYNNVYKIDDKYVLRVLKEASEKPINVTELQIQDIQPVIKQLKTYEGAKLAKSCGGAISILKNADSKKIAIPVGADFSENKVLENSKNFEKSIKNLSTMPQKAYDDIAQDMKTLTTAFPRQFFDYHNPNNFIMVNDKIKIVDDITKQDYNGCNDFASLLSVFLTSKQVDTPALFDEGLMKERQNILKKCILSSEKNDLSLDGYDMKKILSKAMYLAGYDDSKLSLDNLKTLRKKYPDAKQRLSGINEVIENFK